MKHLLRTLALVFTAALATPAFAGGYGYGYGYHHHHHHHGGYGYRGGAWNNHWVGPVVGAAIVGSVIYAARTPAYAVSPQVVTVTPPVVTVAPPAPRVAYFCSTSQQFYPNVPTCNVPWQLVSY